MTSLALAVGVMFACQQWDSVKDWLPFLSTS
jgi:hypothetical protein